MFKTVTIVSAIEVAEVFVHESICLFVCRVSQEVIDEFELNFVE